MNSLEFKKELEDIINKYNMESGSSTPDFILAEYLTDALINFNNTIKRRNKWYGLDKKIDDNQLKLPSEKSSITKIQ